MIFRLLIGVILISVGLYYLFCFLEVFGILKWSSVKEGVKFPKLLIPYYYLIKNDKKKEKKS
jgi:Mn2+/Fe2+ NRAMP family transporter